MRKELKHRNCVWGEKILKCVKYMYQLPMIKIIIMYCKHVPIKIENRSTNKK